MNSHDPMVSIRLHGFYKLLFAMIFIGAGYLVARVTAQSPDPGPDVVQEPAPILPERVVSYPDVTMGIAVWRFDAGDISCFTTSTGSIDCVERTRQ